MPLIFPHEPTLAVIRVGDSITKDVLVKAHTFKQASYAVLCGRGRCVKASLHFNHEFTDGSFARSFRWPSLTKDTRADCV